MERELGFSPCVPLLPHLPGKEKTQGLKRLRKKVPFEEKGFPQRLKPNSLQSGYVRPKGRTLQRSEFFRSLQSPDLCWASTARLTCPGLPWKSCPDTKHPSDDSRKLAHSADLNLSTLSEM